MPAAAFQTSPTPYVALMGAGFLIGLIGHVVKSRPVVATGVLMIFLATVALPLAAHLSR